jgi:hypothetical protein
VSRKRSAIVWTIVVVASVVTLTASLVVWSKRQLLDTNEWTNSSAQLLADPQIRAALSAKLVDVVYANVNVTQRVENRLPKQAQGAAPVIAGAIRSQAPRVVDEFLATAAAQRLWENANRRAHTSLVRVLEGKKVGPRLATSTANGEIDLNVGPMVKKVAARLGVANSLPASASNGKIVLIKSKHLKTAQTAIEVLNALSVFLVIAAVGLYALAVFLARGRRRTFLEIVGGSILIVGLLVLIARRLTGNALIDAVVQVDANRAPAHTVWDIETSVLRDIGIALVVYGVFAVLAGWLGGPSRAATAIRRTLAPTFRRHPLVVHTVALVVFLAVAAWGPFSGGRRLLGLILLLVLLELGLEVWRRETVREFPDAGEPGTARREAPSERALDELEQLSRLRASGALSETEFETAKASLLRT